MYTQVNKYISAGMVSANPKYMKQTLTMKSLFSIGRKTPGHFPMIVVYSLSSNRYIITYSIQQFLTSSRLGSRQRTGILTDIYRVTSEFATIDADIRFAGSTEYSARAFLIALV